MEILRTFVCPGRWDDKTKQTVEMHGGWWNTKTSDKCPKCGKDAITREDANCSIRYHFDRTTMSEHEERQS